MSYNHHSRKRAKLQSDTIQEVKTFVTESHPVTSTMENNDVLKEFMNDNVQVNKKLMAHVKDMTKSSLAHDTEKAVHEVWLKHKHQLFCALCESFPDGDDYEQYWGECSRTCPVTNKETTLVLCPQCLHSNWTLYKPTNMKVSMPTFDDSTTITQMKWNLEKNWRISRTLMLCLQTMDDPEYVCPTTLLQYLEPFDKTGVRIEDISRWKKRPSPVCLECPSEGMFWMWSLTLIDDSQGPYRFRTGPPTVLKKILDDYVEEYTTKIRWV